MARKDKEWRAKDGKRWGDFSPLYALENCCSCSRTIQSLTLYHVLDRRWRIAGTLTYRHPRDSCLHYHLLTVLALLYIIVIFRLVCLYFYLTHTLKWSAADGPVRHLSEVTNVVMVRGLSAVPNGKITQNVMNGFWWDFRRGWTFPKNELIRFSCRSGFFCGFWVIQECLLCGRNRRPTAASLRFRFRRRLPSTIVGSCLKPVRIGCNVDTRVHENDLITKQNSSTVINNPVRLFLLTPGPD